AYVAPLMFFSDDVRTAACSTCLLTATARCGSYTLSLHDALPISGAAAGSGAGSSSVSRSSRGKMGSGFCTTVPAGRSPHRSWSRSEEHTSALQSRENLVCRLLPEKKKQ